MERLIYGHIVDIQMYKSILEKEGIKCFVKNEFEQAANAGFGAGLPGNADLFVDQADFKKAEDLINSLNENDKL
jgi:hypothetical protein